MNTPDPFMTAYVAGLDLVPVQMAVMAAAIIGRAPLADAINAQSVVLYCRRHSNVERLVARVRSEFANVPARATLSDLVSTALKLADVLGVTVLTETEVRMAADEAIARMEAELRQLQTTGGLSAINRTVQNDAAAAEGGVPAWHRGIFSSVDDLGLFTKGVIPRCWDLAVFTSRFEIIGLRLIDTLCQLGECVSSVPTHSFTSRGEACQRLFGPVALESD